MKTFTMVELFSGIGAQAKAFERVCAARKDSSIAFETLNTCEWDIHAIVAYYLIHRKNKELLDWSRKQCIDFLKDLKLSNNGKNLAKFNTISRQNTDLLQLLCTAIVKTHNLIDVTIVKGKDIPNRLDILTYSFPCQDLSNVGAFHGGLKGIDRDAHTRSGLLWEVERILKERANLNLSQPRFLILENVTTLEDDRNLHNFNDWKGQLESLGYKNVIFKLDSLNLGIPQHRQRLIMLSVFVGKNGSTERKKKIIDTYFANPKNNLNDRRLPLKPLSSILKTDYSNATLFEEAKLSQPNDTKSRLKIWNRNAKLLDQKGNCARNSATITTKQDRHPNSGNVYFDYHGNTKSKFRYLTPRECMLLMGFDDKDYESLIENNPDYSRSTFFARDKIYKLAGNSIVVNVLEQVFDAIVNLDALLRPYSL